MCQQEKRIRNLADYLISTSIKVHVSILTLPTQDLVIKDALMIPASRSLVEVLCKYTLISHPQLERDSCVVCPLHSTWIIHFGTMHGQRGDSVIINTSFNVGVSTNHEPNVELVG